MNVTYFVPRRQTATLWLSLADKDKEVEKPTLRLRNAPGETLPVQPRASAPATVASGANLVQRVFAAGDTIHYECDLLGARVDKAEGMPRVEVQMRLAGPALFDFRSPLESLRAIPGDRQRVSGRLALPAGIAPGHYDLSIIPVDRLKPDETNMALDNAMVDVWVEQPHDTGK